MDALAAARKRIAERINDPKARMFGLSDDLAALLKALDELERRTAVLAAFALHKHYWPGEPMHVAVFEALAEMGANARAKHLTGEHGKQCTCIDCMAQVLTKGRAQGG